MKELDYGGKEFVKKGLSGRIFTVRAEKSSLYAASCFFRLWLERKMYTDSLNFLLFM